MCAGLAEDPMISQHSAKTMLAVMMLTNETLEEIRAISSVLLNSEKMSMNPNRLRNSWNSLHLRNWEYKERAHTNMRFWLWIYDRGWLPDLPLLCRCEDWCEVGGWACASYNKSSLRSWAGEGVNGWIPSVEAISTNVWASCNGTDKDTKTSDRFQLPWWLGKCCENLWKWSLHEIL